MKRSKSPVVTELLEVHQHDAAAEEGAGGEGLPGAHPEFSDYVDALIAAKKAPAFVRGVGGGVAAFVRQGSPMNKVIGLNWIRANSGRISRCQAFATSTLPSRSTRERMVRAVSKSVTTGYGRGGKFFD